MDKNSKIFFIIFFSITIFAVSLSFYKYFIVKDYYITLEAECNPESEKCFVFKCDPAEDSECSENVEERTSYYKLIVKKASTISLCDSGDSECQEIVCKQDEECEEIFCDSADLGEDESCSSYTKQL